MNGRIQFSSRNQLYLVRVPHVISYGDLNVEAGHYSV